MNLPLVTVFMPVYNSEKYIADSLDSIINQTYTNLEILLVDDGSTDHSVKIIESYKDNRIRLIRNNENMGIPYTRNVGLQAANGKYITIMDSDDISVSNRIEKQVNYLEKNHSVDVVGSYYFIFGGKNIKKFKSRYTNPDELSIFLLFYNPIANPSTTIRRSSLIVNNIKYNNNYFVAQDYDLWAQISMVGNISIMPEFLLRYRTGHDNITRKSMQKRAAKRKQIIDLIHENLLQHYEINLSKEDIEVYNNFFSENPYETDDLSAIPTIMNKMITWNRSTGTFDHHLFLKILNDAIVLAISSQRVSLGRKIYLYYKLTKFNINDIAYIIGKHFYRKLKS